MEHWMEEEFTEETTEEIEAGTETGEEESAETLEQVEYELDEDGEPVLDEEGNPVPKVAEGEAEEKGKPDHKKDAQTRIQELANKNREQADRLARLEAQFAQKEAEKPDYVEVDVEKVNLYIQTTTDKIDELKLEGDFLGATKLQNAINKLIADLDENDKKRESFLNRQKENKKVVDTGAERMKKLDGAAEFYRTNAKIDKPVWDQMGAWFAAECQKDPNLGMEFAEKVEHGEIGAIKWAHDYTMKNMGAKECAAIETKNINKQKAAGASPTPGGKLAPVDLSKELAKATEENTTEGWVRYQGLKRQAQR
jgi:hypothetical protein